MHYKQKYIRTKKNDVIVFSETLKHSDFRGFNPISAGFVRIFKTDGLIDCSIYGESVSLDMKPKEDDKFYVLRHIVGLDTDEIDLLNKNNGR